MEHLKRGIFSEEENNIISLFESGKKTILNLSLFVIVFLLAGVIMISLRLLLPAGILILIACAGCLLIYRKSSGFIRVLSLRLEELSELSGKKDSVITDFSHRIRETLNTLVILGELLMESGPKEKQKELIETLVASTNNMVDTVNNLTMQSAGVSYEGRKKIRFNLSSTIRNTIDLFKLRESSVLDFQSEEEVSSDYSVIGDPITVKQILLDIFNVLEAGSRNRSTKVKINISETGSPDEYLHIGFAIVTDRGVPFPENDKTVLHAFRLIEESGGRYRFESGNEFTKVIFSLPFIHATQEERNTIASSRFEVLKLREKPTKDLKEANILLVEDNQINQRITMLTLKPLVKSIDTAPDGREALEKFGSFKYDLILMDIQMPVMSGLVAAEKIRELEASTNEHTPIIAITANAMLGDKERCLSAGMDDYISKPFQPSSLIEIIKKNL